MEFKKMDQIKAALKKLEERSKVDGSFENWEKQKVFLSDLFRVASEDKDSVTGGVEDKLPQLSASVNSSVEYRSCESGGSSPETKCFQLDKCIQKSDRIGEFCSSLKENNLAISLFEELNDANKVDQLRVYFENNHVSHSEVEHFCIFLQQNHGLLKVECKFLSSMMENLILPSLCQAEVPIELNMKLLELFALYPQAVTDGLVMPLLKKKPIIQNYVFLDSILLSPGIEEERKLKFIKELLKNHPLSDSNAELVKNLVQDKKIFEDPNVTFLISQVLSNSVFENKSKLGMLVWEVTKKLPSSLEQRVSKNFEKCIAACQRGFMKKGSESELRKRNII